MAELNKTAVATAIKAAHDKHAAVTAAHKSNTKTVLIRLHVRNDADILSVLSYVDNKNGYIKALIRRDQHAKKEG